MAGRVKRAALAALAEVRAERDARWERQLRRESGGRSTALTNYVLDGREIVRAPFSEWGEWFERASRSGARIVRQERARGLFVSTVFLGIDHRFPGLGEGPPLLFETMVFDERDEGTGRKGRDLAQWRWCTYAEAEAGHAFVMHLAESGAPLDALGDG